VRSEFPVSLCPAGIRQQADRHDQHLLTRNTVLVVLMGLACIPRSRDGPTGRYS
jgi:hypothetical protein